MLTPADLRACFFGWPFVPVAVIVRSCYRFARFGSSCQISAEKYSLSTGIQRPTFRVSQDRTRRAGAGCQATHWRRAAIAALALPSAPV